MTEIILQENRMPQIKISIITAFQRGKQYLPDYFESLCEQTFSDFEVVLVLDHAEDISDILEQYRTKLTIRVYALENGTGVAAARNFGLRMAQGEYVYFMDADDYLLEHTLERFMLAQAAEPQLQLLYGNKKKTWYKRSITLETLRTQRIERWKKKLTKAQIDFPEDADEATLESLVMSAFGGNEQQETENAEDAMLDTAESEVSETDSLKALREADDTEGFDSEEQAEGVEADEHLSEEEARRISEAERKRLRRIKQAAQILISSRHGIKNISALHILIQRDFLLQNQIWFDEEAVYYADLTFVVQVLDKVQECRRVYSSKYYQRKHNDPINLPSIAQLKSEDRFTELLTAYSKAIALLPVESGLVMRLHRKLINYFCNFFAVQMHRSPQTKWKEERFEQMQEIVSRIDKSYYKGMKRYKRRIINALKKGNAKKVEWIATMHLAWVKGKKVLKKPSALKLVVYNHIYKKKPLEENTVLFESFLGKFYSDSPKYIFEYMAKKYPNEYNYVWVINDKKTEIPYPCRRIKRFSLKYYYYMACSKYIVSNMRQPGWMVHRDGMVFLETWHGTPLKRLVMDMEEVLSADPLYKQKTYNMTRMWDYLISPNEFCTHTFRRCFMFDNVMLNTGYPRNDILHQENREELAKQIRAKLGIPENKKTILYAPTWRDDEFYGAGQYKFSLKLDLQQMKENLSDEYVVLLRTHYFIADAIDTTGMEDFVFNVCRYNDIAELYLISDILITDYSSVFFDYAGLKRPMLFYTYDLEKYRDDLRGFYIDMETEVPGPLLLTTGEVIDAIQHIDEVNAKYAERYEAFYKRFCGWEDGHAAEKIVEFIFRGKSFDNHGDALQLDCEKTEDIL